MIENTRLAPPDSHRHRTKTIMSLTTSDLYLIKTYMNTAALVLFRGNAFFTHASENAKKHFLHLWQYLLH